MNYILSDGTARKALMPFTFTRPVAAIRIGILTIAEKWKKYVNKDVSFLTEAYLQARYPLIVKGDNSVINGSCFFMG